MAPDAILATNTSSLSVEEMGADVGLHFFNPVAVMPLVEIVRTPQTTDEQLVTAWDVVKKLKKRGVIVGDAPGFVVNRILTRMTRVLLEALENGNTVEETDEAMLSLGMPMAPSVLLQMVGPASRTTCSRRCTGPAGPLPAFAALAAIAAATSPCRSRRAVVARRDARPSARGRRRRGPPPAGRGRRRRPRRRRRLPYPRRRLAVLHRRERDAVP